MRTILLACSIIFPVHAEDVSDIIRTYLDHEASRLSRMKNYTYQMRSEKRAYDRSGKLKSREVKILEFVYQSHGLSVRMIGRNGKPVSPKEALKEQQELERRAAAARPSSGKQLLERYRFQLETVEELNGRPTWVISGQSRTSDVRSRMRLWIDQADYECAKVEDELTMDFNGRYQHAQVDDKMTFELVRMEEGVWLPSHTLVRYDHRLPPLQRFDHREFEITYTNYRKFQTESQIVDSSTGPGDW
jgi:hypothetical protein